MELSNLTSKQIASELSCAAYIGSPHSGRGISDLKFPLHATFFNDGGHLGVRA